MQKGGVSPLQPGDGLHSRFQGSSPDSVGASAQQEGCKTTATPEKKAAGKKK